ncbi:glycogen synthase GlgA [Pelagibius litoralis]|uniref:Glycogen synthase n=1 Tax=Pelagibius litoralis TaxID=374515 RepID=A0A967EYW2_9PROT|nr:glycogen synthase GlgA [Pelagibius litoralis]NIA69947.1 glycogen synthase GlgA [Pelagibius litoralis]
MKVLFVASECVPFVKTGGLADVVGALPAALATEGVEVRVLLPAYPPVKAALSDPAVLRQFPKSFGGRGQLIAGPAQGLDVLALDAPHLYDRPGNPYLGPNGKDWPDNHLRYGALCRVAARIATEGCDGWQPDLIHLHDWQAGLTAAYLKLGRRPAPPCMITIHNIAFQGLFPPATLAPLGLPKSGFQLEGFEYFGKIGFLKAGLVYADRITTVSPTYARELTSPEFGMGLEGVIAARRAEVSGILNGIDLDTWNPETDKEIAAGYSARGLVPKAENRRVLAERFGLAPDTPAPLFCVVSRLTRQKGLDLLLETLPRLLARGASLAILGSGDADMEAAYVKAARDNPGRVGVVIGYDEALSHLMQAGADAILVPSRFEPCGLTQLYGLRYGTLPVVARTGGLADTVIDANEAALQAGVATGFQFAPVAAAPLADAVDRACDVFADKKLWTAMVRRAMKHPVGWETSAAAYARIYREMTGPGRNGAGI